MNPPSPRLPPTSPPGAQCHYRVDDLRIDVGRQRVTRDGQLITLTKLSFDLLLALVRGAPDLISSPALLEQVWPRRVVNPETLIQRVKLLRDALGDDRRNPRYVEGLRGRGYRLIPPVEACCVPVPAGPADPAAPAAADSGALAPTLAVSAGTVPAEDRPRPTASPRHSPSRGRSTHPLLLLAVAIAGLVLASVAVVLTWAMRLRPPARSAMRVAAVAAQPRTIAILPFKQLSPAAIDDLAPDLAQLVLRRIGRVAGLIAVAPSSLALVTAPLDARELGRRLAVRYLIEGTVQSAGGLRRVTIRLVDTQGTDEPWSLTVAGGVDELLRLHYQIAEQLARELEVTLRASASDAAQYAIAPYVTYSSGPALTEALLTTADVAASIRGF
ncbi:MAG: winged helix-turn-helix domain-containing protein [Steroidobacteraceae bacterium]